MIRKHHRCRGIRIWKWGNFQIEVWFVPLGEQIEPHVHQHIDSNIVLLYGRMFGFIGDNLGWAKKWKKYPIPAGVSHAAAAHSFIVFANLERWAVEPTSAAQDFTAV